jgi:hypothetical protein
MRYCYKQNIERYRNTRYIQQDRKAHGKTRQ